MRVATENAAQTHQITHFADGEDGISVSLPFRADPTRQSLFASSDSSMANFFERPVLTQTYTWTPGQATPFAANMNPWADYFSNKRVINRLSNYSQLNCKLHVKMMINGNGFYYGRLLCDYVPLVTYDNVSTNTSTSALMQASQRMKVFLDPACSGSAQFDLPFVWFRDTISISLGQWAELGQINLRELSPLKHANGGTQPITITVMVWASDVQLAMPTSVNSSSMVPQAGEDEYAEKPISLTATAVEKMASSLTSVPLIAPFARATALAARGVAATASAFGFARPNTLDSLSSVRPTFTSSFANCNMPDSASKLTVDAKQEVSIDTNVIGVDLGDEMTVAGIAARESYLTSFQWTTAAANGSILWNAKVQPMLANNVSGVYTLPACTFASVPFRWWRGKMRYRFQVVASTYHRGRIRVVWDPLWVSSVESNVQYTRIIDIAEERDITVEIDWGQSARFVPLSSVQGSSSLYRPGPAFTTAGSNGVIGLYVMNSLATPNAVPNNDISVNVFVSCVDAEYAEPVELPQFADVFTATVQAGDDAPDDGCDPGSGVASSTYECGDCDDVTQGALVYFGERIFSFRQLLKRYSFHSSMLVPPSSATVPSIWLAVLPDYPPPFGYNNTTMHTAATGKKFNFVKPTMLVYLSRAFAAVRGSQRSKYVLSSGALGVHTMTVSRSLTGTHISLPIASQPFVATAITQSNYAQGTSISKSSILPGGTVVPVAHQPVIEVEFPYYSTNRFASPRDVTSPTATGFGMYESAHRVEVTLAPNVSNAIIDRYVSVGEDFNLMWFQGCPPLVLLTIPAT